jgi:hypothetical protein
LWCASVIPAPRRLRQVNQEFNASLGYNRDYVSKQYHQQKSPLVRNFALLLFWRLDLSICPGWPQTMILPISASQVAKIISMSCLAWVWFFFFCNYYYLSVPLVLFVYSFFRDRVWLCRLALNSCSPGWLWAPCYLLSSQCWGSGVTIKWWGYSISHHTIPGMRLHFIQITFQKFTLSKEPETRYTVRCSLLSTC